MCYMYIPLYIEAPLYIQETTPLCILLSMERHRLSISLCSAVYEVLYKSHFMKLTCNNDFNIRVHCLIFSHTEAAATSTATCKNAMTFFPSHVLLLNTKICATYISL